MQMLSGMCLPSAWVESQYSWAWLLTVDSDNEAIAVATVPQDQG
jgi:hypothetical protein